MKYRNLIFLPVAAISYQVHAEKYLTLTEAQQEMFPNSTFVRETITLTKQQAKWIKKHSGVNVRHKKIQAWKVSDGGWFILDDVVGKHEFITYAIGLNSDGSVKQVEIMEYKETYGGQVRNAKWLAQFKGKTSESKLKLDSDIKNISGATLSSKHITDGVKRILATFEHAIKENTP